MKPLIRSFLCLASALMPLAAQPAAAAGPGPRGGALQLTEPQRASIRAIREKHGAGLARRREELRQAGKALQAAWQDPATPDTRLRVLHEAASTARFELMLARREIRREVQAVLTPEQRTLAAERRGEIRGRMQERMRGFRRDGGRSE